MRRCAPSNRKKKDPFLPVESAVGACAQCVTNSDTEMASSDKHDAVKAVKMKYFNWWLDDSFLQT